MKNKPDPNRHYYELSNEIKKSIQKSREIIPLTLF
jgi:hypothetical protein